MPNIFTPPIPSQPLRSTVHSKKIKRKRLEADGGVSLQQEDEQNGVELARPTKAGQPAEYTAAITPDERKQRQTAGQPLNQAPPALPFPHASFDAAIHGRKHLVDKSPSTTMVPKDALSPRSLHMQHLSALTAIVHRAVLQDDFPRASRAIGLMFREDNLSQGATARSQGFMGIAAEVLLRNGSRRRPDHDVASPAFPFTHEGFAKAKLFYERLIIRHPYHKSWPGAVNAVDFHLAMFNLWIYVVHNESKAGFSAGAEEDDGGAEPARDTYHLDQNRTSMRELEQANEIASRMDTCMTTVPFVDEPDLIRLRAMVALWNADLHRRYAAVIRRRHEQDRIAEQGQSTSASPAASETEAAQRRVTEHEAEAARSRDLGQRLLSRLEGRAARARER